MRLFEVLTVLSILASAVALYGVPPTPIPSLLVAKHAASNSTFTNDQCVTRPLTNVFRDDTFHFAIQLPAGYTATDYPDPGPPNDDIELVDQRQNDNITIITSLAPDNTPVLTSAALLNRFPALSSDLSIVASRPYQVARNIIGFYYHKDQLGESGLWFEYKATLYQITTKSTNCQFEQIIKSITLF